MSSYITIDYLPDLTASGMSSARQLVFNKYEPVSGINSALLGWDNSAYFSTSEDYALLHDEFIFEGKEGATYDIFSSSFFDPFILLLYDNKGNVIATDKDDGSYGSDMIFNYVAPYTGKYYIAASWDQGYADAHKYVSVSVYEDVDTIPKSTATTTTIQVTSNVDRIFNWAESVHPDLFPSHTESQDVFGYHARIYSNGNALGEKNNNIYFYDGGSDGTGEIYLVGKELSFLVQAASAGF